MKRRTRFYLYSGIPFTISVLVCMHVIEVYGWRAFGWLIAYYFSLQTFNALQDLGDGK